MDRDAAQRIGDSLYFVVELIKGRRLGWLWLVALFGITLPIFLLRQRFEIRLRVLLSLVSFVVWLQLVLNVLTE
jgi:hypothetical protein